jgi:putative transposase
MKGYDWNKRVKGRKRHILVDTEGWLLTVQVTAANHYDNQQLWSLIQAGVKRSSRLRHLWVDQGYRAGLIELLARHRYGLSVEVVTRPKGHKGWLLLPRRWVVERTFAWLGRFRRLSKDYEFLPHTSEAMIYSVMTTLMLRRLTRPVLVEGAF